MAVGGILIRLSGGARIVWPWSSDHRSALGEKWMIRPGTNVFAFLLAAFLGFRLFSVLRLGSSFVGLKSSRVAYS